MNAAMKAMSLGGAVKANLDKATITVNPRYGAFDPQTASVQLTQPGWITSPDAPQ